jgi:hypothetical protein
MVQYWNNKTTCALFIRTKNGENATILVKLLLASCILTPTFKAKQKTFNI